MAIVRYRLDPNKPPRMSAEELSRLRALRDEDIDTRDIPELDYEVWRSARGRATKSHNKDYVAK